MDILQIFAVLWTIAVTLKVALIVRRVLKEKSLERQIADTYAVLNAAGPDARALYDLNLKKNCSRQNPCIFCQRFTLTYEGP